MSADAASGPPRRLSRLPLILGVGLLLIWTLALVRFRPTGSGEFAPPDLAGPGASTSVDFSWTLRDPKGAGLTLGRYRGRPIVVNYWSTGCPPCLEEMPALAALSNRADLSGVSFLAVSVDPDYVEGSRLVSSRQPSRIEFLGADDPSILPLSTGPRPVEALPTTLIVAPSGRVSTIQVGAAQWDDPKVVELLKSLLAGRDH